MFRTPSWLRPKDPRSEQSPVRALFAASESAGAALPRPLSHASDPVPEPAPQAVWPPDELPLDEAAAEEQSPQGCAGCGSSEVLFHIEQAPICHACLAARFPRDAANYQRWLLGEQLRGIQSLAQAGTPLPPETALALIGDVRRLRRCVFQIQEAILELDRDPAAWSDTRELGRLVAHILSWTQEVDPLG